MEVVVHSPIGYCGGVALAVNKALESAEREKRPVYMLFSPVHNERVEKKLEAAGIILLKGDDPLALIPKAKGGLLLFGAHGHPASYEEKARSEGIDFLDLTCPFVKAAMTAMEMETSEGHDIVYVGEKNHQECVAALSISSRIFLFEKGNTKKLPIIDQTPVLRSQTTVALSEIAFAQKEMAELYPHFIDRSGPCPSTEGRQNLLKEIPENADLIVVLGSSTSRNTASLAKEAERLFPNALVVRALDADELRKNPHIAERKGPCHLLSGASSDPDSIDEAREYLSSL